MKKIVLLALAMVFVFSGCTVGGYTISKMKSIKPDLAKEQALAFINGYLVAPDSQVTLGDAVEVSGLYELPVNVNDGRQVKAYLSQDGKYFFTEGIEIEKAKQETDQQRQQAPAEQPSAQMQSEILAEGTGEAVVKSGDSISVHYKGTLADGTVFDSSYERGEPITFVIGAGTVIKGWDQGLIGMKVGEKKKLIIPPSLAYGAEGKGPTIPPDSTLTFEVELVSINE